MTPGPPALCTGTVLHRRVGPQPHRFRKPISQVWVDPDDPAALCDLHPAWSHRRPAPARFRRSDYGGTATGSLSEAAHRDLRDVLGATPLGPVRMLTQVRRWGWLFNPITIYFVWPATVSASEVGQPVGAVLEVSNTPWKERVRYALPLECDGEALTASFDKSMHVSPFLGMDHRYRLAVDDRDDAVRIDLDVLAADGSPVLLTELRLDREPACRRSLGHALRSEPFPTHRVSAAIHAQAFRLWRKGVPFVSHPRRDATAQTSGSSTEVAP